MARNGSGTFSNPYPNFVSGTVISSTQVDANNSDIATALTQSIAVDGQSTVTANLPMNAKKLTGLAVGAAATDSLNLGQAQAEAMVWCGTAGGSANAITLAPTPAITAYAAGQRFVWKASGSVNTGATTVAISGLGAIALQDNGSALAAGQHQANRVFMGILDTTSTVQVTQVQISGTDPLIVTSLTVSGTATVGGILSVDDTTTSTSGTTGSIHTDGGLGVAGTAFVVGTAKIVGVTTHGDDVVSDTDSTDDLGTTGVRWANLFVDAITATDQVTATGFTGTLDGILGSGSASAATVTTLTGTTITAQTAFVPDASDGAALGTTALEFSDLFLADGAVINLGDDQDVTITHVADTGIALNSKDIAGVASINKGQIGGRRNIVINGAMNVAQRSASVTGLGAAAGYFTLDRWRVALNGTAGRFTMAQVADGPPGFANCIKFTTTTADTSIAAGEYLIFETRFEGQDLQQLKKGTASAEQFTVSFYVKGNAAALYVCEIYDVDNSRNITQSFAVTTSWNRIELTFAADTSDPLDDDNAVSIALNFWLHSGSDHTGGTFAVNTWNDVTAANRAAVDGLTSIFDATSRTFFITGVQMEIGATATEFESRSFGEELALCQRYYQKTYNPGVNPGAVTHEGVKLVRSNASVNAYFLEGQMMAITTMRATPTVTTYSADTGVAGKIRVNATDVTVNSMLNPGANSFGYPFLASTPSAGAHIIIHYVAIAEL